MFIYIHAVDYTILTELDEDINILICSALLVCLPEHKHRAVWLMAIKNIKFKSLGIGYIYIKFNGLIVPATAFFQDDVCGKILLLFFFFCFFWGFFCFLFFCFVFSGYGVSSCTFHYVT